MLLPVSMIGIDGAGGAGKTTLAAMLAKELGAEVLHVDDFSDYRDTSDWPVRVRERVFEPILTGARELSYPRASWWPGPEREPVFGQSVTEVMILEGVHALRSEIRPFLSLGIYVETPREQGLERAKARGWMFPHLSEAQFDEQWRRNWEHDAEYHAREDPKAYADLVIDGTRPYDAAVVSRVRDALASREGAAGHDPWGAKHRPATRPRQAPRRGGRTT